MKEGENSTKLDESYFGFDKTDKSFIIDFGKILNSDVGDKINKFVLKKRSFHSICGLLTDTIMRVFNACEDVAVLPYLEIAVKIRDIRKEYPEEKFIKDILRLNNKYIRKYICSYIEENYVPEINDATEETKKKRVINEELQFTDNHVIILYNTAEAARLTIPLICNYSEIRNCDVNDLLYNSFKELFKLYQGETNMINKLTKFVTSRISPSKYPHKRIWNLMLSKSKDEKVVIQEFTKDVIIGIIPKAVYHMNVINLIHVVIKKKLGFEFQRNYKITFKPINLNQVDSEGLTQFDKWEIGLAKKNENKILINQFSIRYQIKNILKKFNIKITKDEFKYYKDNIKINKPQTNLLFLFGAKYMGSYWNLYSCSKTDYIIMLIIFYKWLKQNSYDILASYIISIPDKLNEKRMASRSSKVMNVIMSSKAYRDLLKKRYSFIEENIINSGIIIRIIGNMSVSKYIKLNDYEEYKKTGIDVELNREVNCKIESLAYEVLEFIGTI